MKRIALTAMIAAFSMTAIQAQEVTERKQEKPVLHEKQKNHLKNDLSSLNLSEDQKSKIKLLKEAHKQQMDELKKEGVPQESFEAIRKQHHEQIQSLLTEEQKAELEKTEQVRKETVKEKKALAEEKKINSGNEQQDIAMKIKAIQKDETLTAEQKQQKTKELVQLMKESKKKEVSAQEVEKFKEQRKHTLGKKEVN